MLPPCVSVFHTETCTIVELQRTVDAAKFATALSHGELPVAIVHRLVCKQNIDEHVRTYCFIEQ